MSNASLCLFRCLKQMPDKAFFCFNLFHVFRYYFTRGSTASRKVAVLSSGQRQFGSSFVSAWHKVLPPLDVNLAAPERRCEQETAGHFPNVQWFTSQKAWLLMGCSVLGNIGWLPDYRWKRCVFQFFFAYLSWLSLYLVLKQSFATNPTVSLAINLFSINFLQSGAP